MVLEEDGSLELVPGRRACSDPAPGPTFNVEAVGVDVGDGAESQPPAGQEDDASGDGGTEVDAVNDADWTEVEDGTSLADAGAEEGDGDRDGDTDGATADGAGDGNTTDLLGRTTDSDVSNRTFTVWW